MGGRVSVLLVAHVGAGPQGGEGVASPADDQFGVVVVLLVAEPVGALERHKPRHEAQVRRAYHVVGAVPGVELAEGVADDVLHRRAVGVQERLGSVTVLDVVEPLPDELVGLVPADALPFVGPALSHAHHGVLQPVRGVHHVNEGLALRAQRPPVEGVLRIPLERDDDPVLDVGDDAAVVMTVAAGGPHLRNGRLRRLGHFGIFLYGLHRLRAASQRSQGRYPRARRGHLQEAPSIQIHILLLRNITPHCLGWGV